MKSDYILSIGAGNNQTILINEIKQMGYKCISCDLDPNAPGKDLSDIFLNISTHSPELIIDEILKQNLNLKAVITRSTGVPVVTTALIAEQFNLVTLSSSIAKILTNKLSFIKKMNQLDIPSPILHEYKKNTQPDQITFPVFVKPSKTNISHAAMKKCNEIEELIEACKYASKVSDNGEVNIEEYLIGQDLVSIDYVFNNEIIHLLTIGEISVGEPSFDGIGWYSCSKGGEEDKLLKNSFLKIKEKLKINHGFFQSAMKANIKLGKAKVYEIHAEIGGDLVNDIFIPSIANKYNIFSNNILLSLMQRPKSYDDEISPTILLFKDKIDEYHINYEHSLIKSEVSGKNHILLSFKNHSDLNSYLEKISSQKNFSITFYCSGD